jgi:transposase
VLELYKDLLDEHTAWVQRIHATVFHHGVPTVAGRLSDPQVRARLAVGDGLSEAGAQSVRVALRVLDCLDAELDQLHRQVARFAARQPGCRQLQRRLYGVGPITAAAIWAFLGDTRRFSASGKAVRHTGLDVTVYASDANAPAVTCPGKAPRCCGGHCTRRRCTPPTSAHPTTTTTPRYAPASTASAPR